MTSLIEKTLITGFGIFVLIIFLIMISPFLQNLEEYQEDDDNDEDLEMIGAFINQINSALKRFIENPVDEIIEEINYPRNINITIIDNYVKFDFIMDNKNQHKILSYNDQFMHKNYFNLPSRTYQLNITRTSSLINVDFKNI